MRSRLLPLRFRVVVAIIALCGLSCLFIVADLAGAGRLIGLDEPESAVAVTCVLSPQGCSAGSVSGDSAVISRTKQSAGATNKSSGSTSGTVFRFAPLPATDANGIALLCLLLTPRPWYCPSTVVSRTASSTTRPSVTLSDLAAFRPVAPTLVSEPRGWGLIRLPINFIAGSGTQVVNGTLLGESASVRFTPVSYRWSYGDGSAQTTSAPGKTWLSLGLADFSPTATSHTYVSTQVFTVTVAVSFRVEYRIGSGAWKSVNGTLSRSASTRVSITDGGTPLLVSRNCVTDPSAAGC